MINAVLRSVESWEATAPRYDGHLSSDTSRFGDFIFGGEVILSRLPAKSQRTGAEQEIADRVFRTSRVARARFLRVHAEHVYDVLTNGRRNFPGLRNVALAAAEKFPGLTPTREQLDVENRNIQAHKEGREIDQAILLGALLNHGEVGHHILDSMLMVSPRALDLLPEFQRTGRVDMGSVLLERRSGVAHLTMLNLHCLNAEDNALIENMETAVDLALVDDQVRVGVLRGGRMTHPRYAGRRVFSAGINLTDLRNGRISFTQFIMQRELGYVRKLRDGVLVDFGEDMGHKQTVRKPWIAGVDSFAIGGGMQLLLMVDWVIAAEDAFFSLPAANEGIVPGAASLRLARHLGNRLAGRVVLGGRQIRATDVEASLLCDVIVPPAEVSSALETAARDFDNPAVAANCRMLRIGEESPEQLRVYLSEFATVQATRMYSSDVLEKVEKRWARV